MDDKTLLQAIGAYLAHVQTLLECLPREPIAQAVRLLHEARLARRRIFIMGNGGSAATASHFVNDLNKLTIVPGQPRFRAMGLTDNVPLLTAWANDSGYENAFAEQLVNFVEPGDVVVAISGSGNSPNVLRAAETAHAAGAAVIGITGFDGGRLKAASDICILTSCHCMAQVEDVHMVLEHLMASTLREVAAQLPAEA
ncbi:MAG: SIS domain-containing protein [Chloroflexi bacterium]|nr:SIS domain-containing protein [Chloroflexota bacterium]